MDQNTGKIQARVDRLLNKGILFSIFWLMGIGSIISVVSAAKANRMINANRGEVKGKARVWWCFVVGGFGIALWFPIIVLMIYNNVK